MCQVIAMTPRSVPRPAPMGGSAEILFFMGVRYHRMNDDEFELAVARKPARAATKAKTTRKRA